MGGGFLTPWTCVNLSSHVNPSKSDDDDDDGGDMDVYDSIRIAAITMC